jgi:hypothetical protein
MRHDGTIFPWLAGRSRHDARMRKIARQLRKRHWRMVLVATLLPAALAGVFEYFMSGGTSGWVPLWAGVVSGVLTVSVLMLIQARERTVGERAFSKRTPHELAEQIRGLTEMAAKPIVERHRGAWLQVHTRIDDMAVQGSRLVVENLVSYTQPGLVMSFQKRTWSDKLKILDRGDRIDVIGRISDMYDDVIWLEDCELVENDSSD